MRTYKLVFGVALLLVSPPPPPNTPPLGCTMQQQKLLTGAQGPPSSRSTWPIRGGDQPGTSPMPFQRGLTDLYGPPDHPRRAETAERATWGTKTLPRPPTADTPPGPVRVRRKPRRWDPLVPIWGGLPGGGAPAAGALNRVPKLRAFFFLASAVLGFDEKL
jgi:hypothetical protein